MSDGILVHLTAVQVHRLRDQLVPVSHTAADCCAECDTDEAIHDALDNPVPAPPAYGECDTGDCDQEAVSLRWYPDLPDHAGYWLPVCPAHADAPDTRTGQAPAATTLAQVLGVPTADTAPAVVLRLTPGQYADLRHRYTTACYNLGIHVRDDPAWRALAAALEETP